MAVTASAISFKDSSAWNSLLNLIYPVGRHTTICPHIKTSTLGEELHKYFLTSIGGER